MCQLPLSHDVKHPISTIKLLITGLRETYLRQDKEKFHMMLDRLEKTSNRLSSLLDEYTLSGEANLYQTANILDLERLCQDVLDALREEIKTYKTKVTKDFKVSKVSFPKNNLRSIIYNLLHNA